MKSGNKSLSYPTLSRRRTVGSGDVWRSSCRRPSSIIKTQHFTIKVFHNEEFSPIQLLLLAFCVQCDLDAATTWLVKRAVDVLRTSHRRYL